MLWNKVSLKPYFLGMLTMHLTLWTEMLFFVAQKWSFRLYQSMHADTLLLDVSLPLLVLNWSHLNMERQEEGVAEVKISVITMALLLIELWILMWNSEAHSELCQISKVETFAKIINGWKTLTLFTKSTS